MRSGKSRWSEAAGVSSAWGLFGSSFGLAFAGAITSAFLLITFTNMAETSTVSSPGGSAAVNGGRARGRRGSDDQHPAERSLSAGEPEDTQDEIVRINTDARPLALQVALLVPLLAGLVGLFNSFRMMRVPDPTPSGSARGMVLG